ncbi:hypothetical protein GX48_01665 [Paracoccidioides brasiliensis]|nr:hypothetical protein GX48_01665 [Paracoccidioides brasiliensis]
MPHEAALIHGSQSHVAESNPGCPSYVVRTLFQCTVQPLSIGWWCLKCEHMTSSTVFRSRFDRTYISAPLSRRKRPESIRHWKQRHKPIRRISLLDISDAQRPTGTSRTPAQRPCCRTMCPPHPPHTTPVENLTT